MEQEYKYMVCTICATFNHSPYIVDAMNGFTMQETTFPVYYLITDDASTDGEPEVIKQYLADHFQTPYRIEETEDYNLICANHNTNPNCTFIVFLLKYNHYSIKKSKLPYQSEWRDNAKYIALCEGDDYWTDSNKLQKQTDFLEKHPKHTMCIHAFRRDSYDGSRITSTEIYKYSNDVEIIPDKDVINGTGMFGATASMVYRKAAVNNYPDWAIRAPVGDRPLKFVLFARGHIAYINEVMSVYRIGVVGSWTLRVNRNHKAEKENRRKFVQLLNDFDAWTDKKYHILVIKAIHDYEKACKRNDYMHYIFKPLRFLRCLLFKNIE